MGILDALFGSKEHYLPLDPSSPAATLIAARSGRIEAFVKRISGCLELVPAADALYVFIGNPPRDFGMAWFDDGGEVSFLSLREQRGLSRGRIQVLSAKLGAAYGRSAGAARYATTIAGKEVVVTPSDTLAAEIRQAIDEAVS